MNPSIQVRDITLAANATQRVAINGSFLLIYSNTGAFTFSLDGGPVQQGLSILGIDVARDFPNPGGVVKPPILAPTFKEIIFADTSGSANTIRFIVANYPVTYINPLPVVTVQNSQTYTKGSTLIALGAGNTDNYTGLDGAKVRKQFVVCNLSATLNLQVVDPNGNVGATVFPQSSWTIESGGQIGVKNPNGAGVQYEVMETFYS